MKKFIATALACVLALGLFSGCALTTKDDSNVVIATVNGEAILKKDYDSIYNYYYYMYTSYYGYDASTAAASLEGMKSDILGSLVEQTLLKQKAKAEGYFEFTEEQKAEAQKAIDEDKNSFVSSLVSEYTTAFEGQEVKGKNAGETDEEYFTRIATEKYLKNLKDNNTSEEQMLQEQLENNAIEKYREDKLKDVTVLDADVMTRFNELSSTQEQEISTDDQFVSAWNKGSITGADGSTISCDPLLYYREGYSLVQHILINYDEDDQTKLQSLSGTIAEYDEEIADRTATLENETDEAIKLEAESALKEATAQKATYQAQYDELLAAAKAKIQSKTDEVYASVKGADEDAFVKVIVEKSDDTGMKDEETAKKGYLVGPSDGMVPEFSAAATKLNEGEVSEPVATVYGYHIIRCIKKLNAGKVAFDDVKDGIKENLLEEQKNSEWLKMLEQFKSEAKIKTFENKL